MADILELEFGFEHWGESGVETPRTPGLHISTILRDLSNRVWKIDKRKPATTSEERKRAGSFWEMGFVWERMIGKELIARSLDARSEVVTQVELEGEIPEDISGPFHSLSLYGTPDGINWGEDCIEEYKATWRSMRTSCFCEDCYREWFTSTKCYCKMAGMTRVVFYVFYVNGDYRESGPTPRKFDVCFSQGEIDETYDMICRHGVWMMENVGMEERNS